ncbi:MAG: MurR/RpiR family transcriptional regulator [Dehalococcoidia bacterium]
MEPPETFDERVNASLDRIAPAQQRVARFIRENREEVLIASASALAAKAGTSDATVVRTAKALGFSGMDELRRALAAELRDNLSPATRLARTLSDVGDDLEAAFHVTLDIHQKALESLRRDITPGHFRTAAQYIVDARRVFIFGIGPSSAMADYFTIQLGRFGIEALSLTQTGLLLADGLQRLREGDLLMIFAYSRVYRELAALLDQADRRGVTSILFTDTLGSKLRDRVDVVLSVARGRADMLSMHTATLGLIEALLVGIATKRPHETMASLKSLNELRTALVGEPMDLPAAMRDA